MSKLSYVAMSLATVALLISTQNLVGKDRVDSNAVVQATIRVQAQGDQQDPYAEYEYAYNQGRVKMYYKNTSGNLVEVASEQVK